MRIISRYLLKYCSAILSDASFRQGPGRIHRMFLNNGLLPCSASPQCFLHNLFSASPPNKSPLPTPPQLFQYGYVQRLDIK